jgi:hypothetical protein
MNYDSFFYINTFRRMCAVPNMAVFFSSLISFFPVTLFRYCVSDFKMVIIIIIITIIIIKKVK